jgi:CHAD domain-containing protein
LLDAIEERLLAAGARPSASRSKLARALGDRVTPAPRPPRDLRTAGDVALAYLHTQYAALLALDPAVRRAEEDAVHRMRVATRRARSALKSFRRELDRTATDPLGAELKWCAAALGGERDREVLAERLHRRLAELDAAPHAESDAGPHAGPHAESDAQSSPVTAAAADAARRRIGTYAVPDRTAPARTPRANANANASATAGAPPEMAGARYFALLDAFQTLLAAPPYLRAAAAPAAPAAAAVLRRDHARLRLGVEEALATDPGDARDTALHEARKEAKRARYSAEAAEAVLGAEATAHTARMKQVQQLLGEHQDSVMCRTAVAALRAAAVAAGEDPAPYDAIIRRERALAADAEARLPEVWQAARQAP